MTILFYISTIRSGGAGRVMVNLANCFSNEGTRVIFATNFKADNEYSLAESVKRVYFEETESKSGFLQKNFKRVSALRKCIRNYSPDILVSFMHENDVRAFFATRGVKCKLLLSVRSDPNRLYSNKFNSAVAKFVYGHADAVVFQTEDAKNWFGDLKAKTKIIYNQIAPEFYNVERIPVETKDIVTVGRFIKGKNHELIIKAFAQIADCIDDNLIIYGDGELRRDYENLIDSLGMNDRIFLPGNTDNVPDVLRKAKLFILSSDYEGMPNCLMEAMAVGVPCISTDCPCGGPRLLIKNGETGILIPVGDEDALSEKMKWVINNPLLAGELGQKAKIESASFAPNKIFGEWKNFIEQVIKS